LSQDEPTQDVAPPSGKKGIFYWNRAYNSGGVFEVYPGSLDKKRAEKILSLLLFLAVK